MRIEMKPGDSLTIAFVDSDGESTIASEVDVDFDDGQDEITVTTAEHRTAEAAGVLLRIPVPKDSPPPEPYKVDPKIALALRAAGRDPTELECDYQPLSVRELRDYLEDRKKAFTERRGNRYYLEVTTPIKGKTRIVIGNRRTGQRSAFRDFSNGATAEQIERALIDLEVEVW